VCVCVCVCVCSHVLEQNIQSGSGREGAKLNNEDRKMGTVQHLSVSQG